MGIKLTMTEAGAAGERDAGVDGLQHSRAPRPLAGTQGEEGEGKGRL